MSEYDGFQSLNDLEPATPLDGASYAELAQAVRQLKSVVKNVLLTVHRPNGTLKGVTVDALASGSVGTAQIIDAAVTASKIADLAVATTALADAAVTAVKLADGAVTAAKLAANSVTSAAFADNSIPLRAIGTPLTGNQISKSGSVDANRAITTEHIRDGAVTDAKINGVAIGKLSGGVAGDIAVRTSDGWVAVALSGGLTIDQLTGVVTFGTIIKSARIGDVKTRGSDAGATLANTWMTRDLGELTDTEGLLTFAGNEFQLVAGKYLVSIKCPAHGAVGRHQARLLRDNGDATFTAVLWGTSEVGVANQSGHSIIEGLIEEDGAEGHSYKVEHWFENAVASNGLGKAASSDNTVVYANHTELYTIGYIARI